MFRNSESSLTSSGRRTAAISMFSSLSFADISNVSVFSLPIYDIDISNSHWYRFGALDQLQQNIASQGSQDLTQRIIPSVKEQVLPNSQADTPQNIPSKGDQELIVHKTWSDISSQDDIDSVIDRLLEVRGSRPGKQVQLLEAEIRYLCTKAREIFISQPILLELEAPMKVRETFLLTIM
jgi:hypothetical protein